MARKVGVGLIGCGSLSLIGILLVFTTPVAAHEIARAAAREQLARIENPGMPPVR